MTACDCRDLAGALSGAVAVGIVIGLVVAKSWKSARSAQRRRDATDPAAVVPLDPKRRPRLRNLFVDEHARLKGPGVER